MTGHPYIGVEYDVMTDDMPTGIDNSVESLVPIGHDDTGNLQVDHYGVEPEGQTLLWAEDGFVELIEDGKLEVNA